MIGKAVALSLWACGTVLTCLYFLGTSPEAQRGLLEMQQQYRQMPLVALPVINKNKLSGLLFLKTGLSWKSLPHQAEDNMNVTLYQDATTNAVFNMTLSLGFDVVQFDSDALASAIEDGLSQPSTSIKEPQVIFLQLDYFPQSALRTAANGYGIRDGKTEEIGSTN